MQRILLLIFAILLWGQCFVLAEPTSPEQPQKLQSPEQYIQTADLALKALVRGDVEQAQVYISELMSLDPNDSDNHALQGVAYALKGRSELAIDSFSKAMELGKSQRTASQLATYANSLVLAYYQADQPKKALEACLAFLQDYPDSPDLYLTCSRLYREKQDYQAALTIAQKGLIIDPEFSKLYASVALAELALGHRELSEQAYQELERRSPELAAELRPILDGKQDDTATLKVQTE